MKNTSVSTPLALSSYCFLALFYDFVNPQFYYKNMAQNNIKMPLFTSAVFFFLLICLPGTPHVVLMTKIDVLCPLVKKDLTEVYRSRKIKDTVC